MPVQLQSHSDDEGDAARIEIIPLIDIMFFLLAAFMLVSLSMTHLRRVPVDLPQASTSIPDSVTPPFQITIDANGVTTRDGNIITLSEITAQLRSSTPPGVMIAADENALHKNVLAVLNAIREAGVEKINFETKR